MSRARVFPDARAIQGRQGSDIEDLKKRLNRRRYEAEEYLWFNLPGTMTVSTSGPARANISGRIRVVQVDWSAAGGADCQVALLKNGVTVETWTIDPTTRVDLFPEDEVFVRGTLDQVRVEVVSTGDTGWEDLVVKVVITP